MSRDLEVVARASRASAVAAVLGLAVVVASTAYGWVAVKRAGEQVTRAGEQVARLKEEKRELEDGNRHLAGRREELNGQVKALEARVNALEALANRALAQVTPAKARDTVDAVVAEVPAAASVVSRVYIHVRSEQQRPGAAAIGRLLRQQGSSSRASSAS